MRKLYFFLTLFAGLALAVGCENNPQNEDKPQPPTPGTTPEITLEQASLECNSFTFTVTTNVEGELVFSRDGDTVWQCANCGHIVVGKKAPVKCPVCDHPQAYFQELAQNY